MAKGSIFGVKRGKLGDVVLYEVTNSADKDKQGWRPYKATIRNPQTDGQIDQRIKLTAANNLYRALKPIIQRGWENHKYGDESRRAFLKRALGSAYVGPYLPKGSTLAVPIEGVPITFGSLPPVTCVCEGAGDMPYFPGLIVREGDATTTIADVSGVFINAGLAQEGDQVTIIFGWVGDFSAAVHYRIFDFIVSLSNTANTSDAIGIAFSDVNVESKSRLNISEFVSMDYSAFEYCCLCSVSRNGDGVNLRSYAELTMTPSFRALFYNNAEQNAAAKRSYRKNQSADTNWPLVPDAGPLLGYKARRGDGQVIVPVAVTINESGYTIVEDSQSNLLYVKCTDVSSTMYNGWLKAKSGSTATDVWNTTAPAAGLQTNQFIGFNAGNDATEDDLSFYNFLVAAGYNGRNLLGLF